MKIIYSGIRGEYYDPQRSPSFEYSNFYLTFLKMKGVEVIEYPYDWIIEIGKREFNRKLLDLVKEKKPDLFFAFMLTDEFEFGVLDEIRKVTTSVAWFADDWWRIHNYSRFWAPRFSWAVTTRPGAKDIYAEYGIENIIESQWACNNYIWKPIACERDIDVSFVGQYTKSRGKIINSLREAGINVFVRGAGWDGERLSLEEMVRLFSRSKINLNLNPAASLFEPKILSRLFLERSLNKYAFSFDHPISNLKSWLDRRIPQIKARPFEILGCKTFLISGFAPGMEKYYEDRKEIIYYDGTVKNLVDKIKYYLSRDKEREEIAEAGYARTIKEHTYEKRFSEIFRKIGLN